LLLVNDNVDCMIYYYKTILIIEVVFYHNNFKNPVLLYVSRFIRYVKIFVVLLFNHNKTVILLIIFIKRTLTVLITTYQLLCAPALYIIPESHVHIIFWYDICFIFFSFSCYL